MNLKDILNKSKKPEEISLTIRIPKDVHEALSKVISDQKKKSKISQNSLIVNILKSFLGL